MSTTPATPATPAIYKIAGKIQKIEYSKIPATGSNFFIFLVPDQNCSLKDGDTNYAVLLPEDAASTEAKSLAYKQAIKVDLTNFDFDKLPVKLHLEPGKRVMMVLDDSTGGISLTIKSDKTPASISITLASLSLLA